MSKCSFIKSETEYFGPNIRADRISVSQNQIKAVMD